MKKKGLSHQLLVFTTHLELNNVLKPGDFIFLYHKPLYMFFGRAIQWITDGAAHVAVVHRVEGDQIDLVESKVKDGCQINRYSASFFLNNKKIDFLVMRPPAKFKYDEAKTHELLAFKGNKDRDYGFLNMLREADGVDKIFRFFGVKRNREQYCSTFADEIGVVQGLYNEDDLYRSPKELYDKLINLGWECVSI